MTALATQDQTSMDASAIGGPVGLDAPRRRVLFTMVELGPGGIETNVVNLLNKLDRRRYDLSLFLHHAPGRRGVVRRDVPGDVGVSWALRRGYRRWQLPFILSRLLPAARDCDVIVAAQEGRATLLAWIAGALLRKPVIGCIQFDWTAAARHTRRRQRWGLRWLCPRMRRIIACGQDAAAALQRLVPLDPDRVRVIANFIDAQRLRRLAREPAPCWTRPIFARPTIAAAGRLEPQKGFDVLIRAHAALRDRRLDHHLLILGEGQLRHDLERLAAELDVADSVFLPGFCENPFPVLRQATAFALSSRYEGLPFALVEAMTLGLPIVATDCPSGPREVLEHGRVGVLAPVDDPAALASALEPLLRDAALRSHYTRAGLLRAAAYADEHALPAWQQVLDDVIAESRRQATSIVANENCS